MIPLVKKNRFSTRLAWLVGLIAVVPLIILVSVAVRGSIKVTERTAKEGLQEIASQVAERIDEIIGSHVRIVEGLAETLRRPLLGKEASQSLLDGYSLRFPELKRVAVISGRGAIRLSNDPSWTGIDAEVLSKAVNTPSGATVVSNLVWLEGVLPTIYFFHRLNGSEVLIAETNIARLWRIMEEISVGQTGKAFILDASYRIIAHGAPEGKSFILKQPKQNAVPFPKIQNGSIVRYKNISGARVLGAFQPVRSLGWTVVVEQDEKEIYAFSRSLTSFLGVIFLLLIGLIIFVGGRTSRVVSRPLEQLVELTRRVAKGDFTVSVPVQGQDERAQLAAAFNQMVKELGQLHDEISRRERMSVIGRIASELIHDLRHPVRNIENAAQLLNSRGSEREVREMFERVTKREFEGLNRFLKDLEQLISDPVPQRAEFDLIAEIRSLAEVFQNAPEGAKLRWNIPAGMSPVMMRTDRFMLHRVLQNILKNAVEASPPGGSIEISVVRNSCIDIAISDSGPGIPADRLPSLFDELRTTKRRGLGLGLAICKKLVGELGGQIQASNRKEGGSTFTVSLPAE